MNRNSLTDYALFALLKAFGPLVRAMPLRASFALGRLLGDLVFLCDLKHRGVVYTNLRIAFAGRMTPIELRRTTREFFRSFGQNLIEIFLIPRIDAAYIRKYVRIEGLENAAGAFAQKKGVLLCSMHAGSWELANILAANLGFPFSMFVRDQKFPRVEGLLNAYRLSKGCRLIQRKDQMRELIRVLRNNEATGLTVDQGGRSGTPVMFFGKEASMSSGAVRLALKYGCVLLPVFLRRVNGPHLQITVAKPFSLRQTGDPEKDAVANLQELVRLFEGHIGRFPHEYLWSYKVWKHSGQRKVLILSDGKTGHLRQSQSLARTAVEAYAQRGLRAEVATAEVRYKSGWRQAASSLLNVVSGRHICRGCLRCLKFVLTADSYAALTAARYDLVISCGSTLAAPNYIVARENGARSFAIMRPSIASLDRFDLLVIPEHDRPPARANVVPVAGALNLIDDAYLREQARQLRETEHIPDGGGPERFGLLIGGNTKEFTLSPSVVAEVCRGMTAAAGRCGAELLVTTSRRTSPEAEREVRAGCAQARLLIIANEKNPSYAVGGILGVCSVVVCSPESISMISEAAASGAYVVVFLMPGLSRRHRRFLDSFARSGGIRLVEPAEVGAAIERLVRERPSKAVAVGREKLRQAVSKVL